MYDRARKIIRHTTGISAAKLLLLTAGQTRTWLRPLAIQFNKLLSDGAQSGYSYELFGRRMRGFLRLAHLDSDLQSALELAVYDCYRLGQISEPDLIVDAGANTGMFCLAATARWPRVKVLACEPVPHNVAAVRKHIEQNGVSGNVEIHEAALGGAATSLDFFVREANQGSFDGSFPYRSVIKVPVVPLRGLLAGREYKRLMIKLDIEGAEREVLEAFFQEPPREEIMIVMELHNIEYNRPFVEDLVRRLGYHLEFFELGKYTGHCQITSPGW